MGEGLQARPCENGGEGEDLRSEVASVPLTSDRRSSPSHKSRLAKHDQSNFPPKQKHNRPQSYPESPPIRASPQSFVTRKT